MLTKVHGAGATMSSVPGLQKGHISRYKYLFLSSASPSGLIVGGRVADGTTSGFLSSMNDCCGEQADSLYKTIPGLSFENVKW